MAAVVASMLAPVKTAWAARFLLKDGRVLQGKYAPVAGLSERLAAPSSDAGVIRQIALINDDLRRTFLCERQILEVREDEPGEALEKFLLPQQARRSGPQITSMGPIIRSTPFDEFGAADRHGQHLEGPGEYDPGDHGVDSGLGEGRGHQVLRLRYALATSSIPPDILEKMLRRLVGTSDPEQRKKLARFYIQAERYEAATAELEAMLSESNDAASREQLEPTIRSLKQMASRRLLNELQLRRGAGQHSFVYSTLKVFPTEGVAGEILQQVREMIDEFDAELSRREQALKTFDGLLAKVELEADRQKIGVVREELGSHLNLSTLNRMAAFVQMAGDEAMTPQERLALAISGWLVGADQATVNLPVALSMYDVRGLVREYLTTPDALKRSQILADIRAQEAGTTAYVARLVRWMLPLAEMPPESQKKTGYYELSVTGPDGTPISYWVQVPPEYDPLRRYPLIVTLNGAGTSPQLQIDWWAGAWQEGGWRAGQASRHGYIVMAPKWSGDHQSSYEYSALEHGAVLYALRDAFRRFSIDTDRVFLSGHSMGGDAAWDIGLAHPDLWAGVIPVVARSDRYCTFYWENAATLPFYVVSGELDGDKMVQNARDLDRCLKRNYPVTVVEYIGRGHEDFSGRDPPPLRLDGPMQTRLLSQGLHDQVDAALGQLFLVGGVVGDAAQEHRAARRLAGTGLALAGDQGPRDGEEHHLRDQRGAPRDRLAHAGDARLRTAGQYHDQRAEDHDASRPRGGRQEPGGPR